MDFFCSRREKGYPSPEQGPEVSSIPLTTKANFQLQKSTTNQTSFHGKMKGKKSVVDLLNHTMKNAKIYRLKWRFKKYGPIISIKQVESFWEKMNRYVRRKRIYIRKDVKGGPTPQESV